MSDFWSRRKSAVKQEFEEERRQAEIKRASKIQGELDVKTDEEVLKELGLPDPDTLEPGDDFKVFMKDVVPERLRRRALKKLWLSNPLLANVDGLVDYGEDFTDAAVGAGFVETTYQVGKGMLKHIEELALKEQEKQNDKPPEVADDELLAEASRETDEVENVEVREDPSINDRSELPLDSNAQISDQEIIESSDASVFIEEEPVIPVRGGGRRQARIEMDERMDLKQKADVSQEDRSRADMYNFLGLVLARPADEILLQQMSQLSGDQSELGKAVETLKRVSKVSKPNSVEIEFNKLFIGVGRGELLPYASYYLTGFLNEKPLAALRRDMVNLGLSRANNVYEPEDNIASLMEMMAALIVGRFGSPVSLGKQLKFFDKHIRPWAGHFFTDLEAAESSILYASVGSVGRLFMEIEVEAFRMSAEKSA